MAAREPGAWVGAAERKHRNGKGKQHDPESRPASTPERRRGPLRLHPAAGPVRLAGTAVNHLVH